MKILEISNGDFNNRILSSEEKAKPLITIWPKDNDLINAIRVMRPLIYVINSILIIQKNY